jgi:hypothetical protein
MITFHAIVRGFEGEFDHIQRNAIRSWQRLHPDVEVVLFGSGEPGAVEAAEELGCGIYPLERNHRGIPFVRYPIERTRELARHDIRCLINADVILTKDFLWAVGQVKRTFDRFLLVTQRYGLKVDREMTFGENWDVNLLMDVRRRGHAKHRKAIDYFCYRGDWLRDVPAFAVGRTSWDNWIVWKALQQGVPVVDASPVSLCVHQEHQKRRVSAETSENRAIFTASVGAERFEDAHVCGLDDATHWLTELGVIEK